VAFHLADKRRSRNACSPCGPKSSSWRNGFEQDELFVPLERLRAAGCEVALAAPSLEPIRATVLDDPGEWITPDLTIARRGGGLGRAAAAGRADQSRPPAHRAEAVALVRAFVAAGKAVGAICHGPWLLIEATRCAGGG
jgi:protease I